MKAADLIEDAEYLVLVGEWPERAALRLGYRNFRSLEKSLQHLGRPDLIRKMRRLDRMSLAYHKSHPTPMDDLVAKKRSAAA